MSETLTLQTLMDLESKLSPVVRYPRIISVNARVVDVPVKTHRKKRIAKKWLKKFGTKTVLDRFLGNKVLIHERENFAICHPDIARHLETMQRELERKINASIWTA